MIFSLSILTLFLSCVLGKETTATSPLWPKPVSSTLGTKVLNLASTFTFQSTKESAFLDQAIERYINLIKPCTSIANSQQTLSSCSVDVTTLNENEAETLEPYVDESYTLNIDESGACKIASPTVWGALHAFETFTQLLERDNNGLITLPYAPVEISDHARFTHRGLLIDSSRHFLPISQIERIIDTLTMSKFNVLHWHMVDAQSFPIDTPSAPRMIKGAYMPSMTYSIDQLQAISTYASNRGIRLFLEIDVPGHAASWTKGYPHIMAKCFQKYSYNINDFALNPTLEETYEVVEKVITDIITSTGVKYFHVGGDEVVYGCWAEDEGIVSYMKENNIASYDELLGYFVTRVDAIIRKLGATPVHWEEVFFAGAPTEPDTVYEVWTSQTEMSAVADANYTVISAPSDVWYLDHAENKWDVMYEYDPVSALTSSQESLVLGGEVCMWGEHVDENNIESIVYPRANSVGERLWSPKEFTDTEEAEDRFNIQRCRMIQRGFHPSAISPGFCQGNLV